MPSNRSVSEELEGIDGFDPIAGLACSAGREGIYRKVLRTFVRTYGHGDTTPTTARSSSNLLQLAHSLRGASATVGALAIASMAAALEQACQTGVEVATVQSLAQDLIVEMARLTAELDRRLG